MWVPPIPHLAPQAIKGNNQGFCAVVPEVWLIAPLVHFPVFWRCFFLLLFLSSRIIYSLWFADLFCHGVYYYLHDCSSCVDNMPSPEPCVGDNDPWHLPRVMNRIQHEWSPLVIHKQRAWSRPTGERAVVSIIYAFERISLLCYFVHFDRYKINATA